MTIRDLYIACGNIEPEGETFQIDHNHRDSRQDIASQYNNFFEIPEEILQEEVYCFTVIDDTTVHIIVKKE